MANVYAVKSGNWSDVTVWNTGALPTSADDVYANNFTVTVDVTATVLTINNSAASGINVGGTFAFANNANLTCTNTITPSAQNFITFSLASPNLSRLNANISDTNVSGTSRIVHSGTGSFRIDGNITPVTYNTSSLISITSSGTLTINGNVDGVSINNGSASIITLSGSGILNVNGNLNGCQWSIAYTVTVGLGAIVNVVGSINQTRGASVFNNNGVVNVTGNVTTSSSANAIGSGAGTVNVTGNVSSTGTGTAIANYSTGTINITGTCTGGSSTGNAFVNASTGTITHIGTAQASPTAAAIGAGAAGQVTILTGPLLSTDASYTGASSSGVNPCVALRWFPADTALGTFEYRMRGQTLSGSPSARPARQMFLTDAYSTTYPSTSNVRSSILYGPGNIYTGTLAVPPTGSVALGVPVDATTGTAALTAANIRDAVGLASANLDTQLSGLSSGQSTILSNLSTLLTNVAAIPSAVWSAATRTLTAAIDQSAAIASAVWSNSSRTVTGGTIDSVANLDAPTEAEIADAVRIELTPELDRVIHTATTQEVADIVESALQAPQ